VLRWGIISIGVISSDFCTALRSFKNSYHVLQAVGARKISDAKAFAERLQIHSHYGSYDEVINDQRTGRRRNFRASAISISIIFHKKSNSKYSSITKKNKALEFILFSWLVFCLTTKRRLKLQQPGI
jgi:hypothetical protein